MGEDVLLVNLIDTGAGRRAVDDQVYAPIGIAYIEANLVAHGFAVRSAMAGMDGELVSQFEALLRDSAARLIGLSATGNELAAVEACAAIKARLRPEVTLLVGGYGSVLYETIVRFPGVDAIALGEGEVTTLELLQAIDAGTPIVEVAGLALSINGAATKTRERVAIADLDTLAVPTYPHYPDDGPFLRVYASRGCPFRCEFCRIKDFFGTSKVRHHGPTFVRRLIERLIERHAVTPRTILFSDDEFLLSPRHFSAMAGVVRDMGLKMRFQTRVPDIVRHSDVLQRGRDVVETINVGVESFADSQLARWSKDVTVEENRSALRRLAELDIPYYPYIILTDGVTTPEEIAATINGLLDLPPTMVFMGIHRPSWRVSPLFTGLHLNRLKDVFGNAERHPDFDYLESLWRFIEGSSRPVLQLCHALFNRRHDEVAEDARDRQLSELIMRRFATISTLAAILSAAPNGQRAGLVAAALSSFKHDAALALLNAALDYAASGISANERAVATT